MKYLRILLWLLISWPITTYAQVSPFGFTIGEATMQDVQQSLSAKTKLSDRGLNKWTGGPMLRAPGDAFSIQGLQEVLFIFDQQKVLMGVILVLPKNRYSDVKAYLSDKYKIVSDQAPFVGNQLIKFEEGDVIIEARAPHMSFQMEVTYIHSSLMEAFNTGSALEVEQKEQREGAQF